MGNTVSASKSHDVLLSVTGFSVITLFGLFLFIFLFDVSFFFKLWTVLRYLRGHLYKLDYSNSQWNFSLDFFILVLGGLEDCQRNLRCLDISSRLDPARRMLTSLCVHFLGALPTGCWLKRLHTWPSLCRHHLGVPCRPTSSSRCIKHSIQVTSMLFLPWTTRMQTQSLE